MNNSEYGTNMMFGSKDKELRLFTRRQESHKLKLNYKIKFETKITKSKSHLKFDYDCNILLKSKND